MKVAVFIVLILALVGALVYQNTQSKQAAAPTPTPQLNTPEWDSGIPANAKEVKGRTPKINVVTVRRNNGTQSVLEFHITEEHGYMVDAIQLRFNYRFQDPETGDWIQDPKRIDYFVNQRLGFNETLVANTVLLDMEFQHLGIDLSATTTENWEVEVIGFGRVMEPA
jgi:hypothetical protein